MSTVAFEAWLERTAPIEIAVPIFQNTKTTVNFTVLTPARVAKNLTGPAKFAGKTVEDGLTIFNKSCMITNAAGGLCSCALTAANLANAGEYLGELTIFESGSPDTAVERIPFRFKVVEVIA